MKRNAYFDNAKLFLIFFVVFGHMIQPYIDSKYVGTFYTWLYTFHMPAFIFLAGFYAKGKSSADFIINLAKKLLIPYLIFQAIYTIYYFYIGKSGWLTDSIFYPHWSLWFLISLFSWHMLLIVYKKMHPTIAITLAVSLGIIVGYFDPIGHLFSLSRTFVFFPFFLLGHLVSMEQLMFLKQTKVKVLSVISMAIIAVAIYFLPDINTGWLLASKSYSTLGMETYGSIARITVYLIAFIMAASFLVWVPQRRFSFTVLGERTLYVYLLHGFIIQLFRNYDILTLNHFGHWIGFMVLSAIIVVVLSSNTMMTIWQPLIEGRANRLRSVLQKIGFKKDERKYKEQT